MTFVDWDFTDIWDIMESCSYPWLRGLPNPHVTNVPDVLGLSRTEAEEEIENSCLVIGEITEQCSDAIPFGNVISQSPSGGVQLAPGSSVDLVISKGPCQEGTPDGEGNPEGTAEGEGIIEGTPEGEGTAEGIAEGMAEVEGRGEGTTEGTREGTTEGIKEGEGGGGGGTDKECGCNKKSMGEEWWKYLVDFVLFGLFISLMSGMGKKQGRKK